MPTTSDAVAAFPFSKKNILIRLLDPEQNTKWDKILTRLGAIRNNSHDDPGWLLANNKVDLFEEAVEQYGSRQRKPKHGAGGKMASVERRRQLRLQDESSPQERKGSRFRTKRQEESPPHREPRKNDICSDDRKHRDEPLDDDDAPIRHRSKRRSDETDDSRESEESSSSEDELIQTILARRLQSESSHKCIEEEEVDNTDNEDCITYGRRLRHVYNVIKEQRECIKKLEEKLAAITNKQ
jgi:hypothetical protein